MRVSMICAAAVSLTALSAPALAADDAEIDALANQMIALCDAALGPQGLEGAAQEAGVTLEAFDFPVADHDITASDQALALPHAAGLSIWTGKRDGDRGLARSADRQIANANNRNIDTMRFQLSSIVATINRFDDQTMRPRGHREQRT